MAFKSPDLEQIEAILTAYLHEVRPPIHVRPRLDYAYTISGNSVLLQEVRPQYDDATRIMVRPFARATYVKARDVWRVYWLRADLKWHSYLPSPIVSTLPGFLKLVQQDAHGCFYG